MLQLSISDAKRALGCSVPAAPEGETSSLLLAQIFHEITEELLGDDKTKQWQSFLDNENIEDGKALTEHIYENQLGPRLTAHQPELKEAGEQVLSLWTATRELSKWLTTELSQAINSGQIHFDKMSRQWKAPDGDTNNIKPKKTPAVSFSSVVQQLPKRDGLHGSARIPLGVDLEGNLHGADLSQNSCPHLLVAGAAGAGKTEWMRTALAGLLLMNTPETLQLVLIDPKRSAFDGLESSPYVYQDWGILRGLDRSIPDVLGMLIDETNRRNLLFREKGVDDLAGYVAKTGKPLARIVLFCDEYFNLIAQKTYRKQIEAGVAKLGLKGRSSGIHLVIATQYPAADVVTSVLKAALSGRVCLRMTEARQSQLVLGQSGGERLLGKGDLLFLDVGEPQRFQAPYLLEEERKSIFASGEY